jgi:hypothetical protein
MFDYNVLVNSVNCMGYEIWAMGLWTNYCLCYLQKDVGFVFVYYLHGSNLLSSYKSLMFCLTKLTIKHTARGKTCVIVISCIWG